MADKKKKTAPAKEEPEQQPQQTPEQEPQQAAADTAAEEAKKALTEKEDQYLRLAAEYDNYRKRTAKEKESAWIEAKA